MGSNVFGGGQLSLLLPELVCPCPVRGITCFPVGSVKLASTRPLPSALLEVSHFVSALLSFPICTFTLVTFVVFI